MWASDAQKAAAIFCLLKAARIDRLERYWAVTGPSGELVRLVDDNFRSSPLSHGETVMLQVALDFWNGSGRARWADLMDVLDAQNLRNVLSLSLAVAAGGSSVQAWMGSFR